jgi:hypothetical protein
MKKLPKDIQWLNKQEKTWTIFITGKKESNIYFNEAERVRKIGNSYERSKVRPENGKEE